MDINQSEHFNISDTQKINASRPGCLTIYGLMMILTSIALFIFSIAAFIAFFTVKTDGEYFTGGIIMGAVALFIGVPYFMFARGIWRMKKWAGNLLLILLKIGNYLFVTSLIISIFTIVGIIPTGIALIINYLVYRWFDKNKEIFVN
jgi:hypothetical protein